MFLARSLDFRGRDARMFTLMSHFGSRDSSFVAHDESEELMAVFAAVVYERGFAATHLSEVAERAGVPLATVIDVLAHRGRLAAGDRGGLDASAVRAGRRRVHEHRGRCSRGAAPSAGADVVRHGRGAGDGLPVDGRAAGLGPLVAAQPRVRAMELFCTFLAPAFAALDEPAPDPEAVSVCLAGGLWELIRRHALERRLHELPDALPAASYVLPVDALRDRRGAAGQRARRPRAA